MKKATCIFSFIIFSQLAVGQVKNDIEYDFSCFETDATSTAISVMGDLEKSALSYFDTEVTVGEEMEVGDQIYDECVTNYTFIESGAELTKLKSILKKLTSKIDNPVGFTYQVYLLDSDMLNAFTAGGKIFFTTEMIRFCVSDDEIACIMGHEIAHNELGHIRDHIKRAKTANAFFGEGIGSVTTFLGKLLSTPFNQINEAHCDMVGIDLARAAGYDACQNANLWSRMNENEGEYSQVNTIFSSHPYSGKRADCSREHLRLNYEVECD